MSKLLTIVFSISLVATAAAQSDCAVWLATSQKATAEVNLAALEAGTRQLETCMQQRDTPDSLLLASWHYFKAEIMRKKSKRDSFGYHLGLAVDHISQVMRDTTWLYRTIRHREGIQAYFDGDYLEAHQIYDEVRQLNEAAGDKSFATAISMIINDANYLKEIDSLDQALLTYARGISLCTAEATPFAEDRLSLLYVNMATVQEKKGDLLEALRYGELGAEYFFRQHDDTAPQAMIIYNNLGGNYLSVNNFPAAVLYLEKAYACFLRDHGPNETPGDVILTNLGNCYQKTGDIEKAIKTFEQVIAIRTKAYGPDHVRTALAEFNASSMYVAIGRPEETIKLLKSCRPKLVRLAGPTHPHIALCDQNLAIAYRANEDYEEALASYQSALRIKEVNLPPDHIEFAVTMRNLSSLFYVWEDYQQALHWIEKAVAIEEKTLRGDGARKGYVSGIYATTLFKAGQREEAFAHYEEAFLQLGLADPNLVAFGSLEYPKSAVGVIGFYLDNAWEAYQDSGAGNYLDDITVRARQGISILEWQRGKFSGDQIKTLWTHNNYRIYEHLIVATLKQYELTGDQAFLSTAEAYSERAKGSILLDALLQSGVSRFAGVPAAVVDEGDRLRNELSFIELTLRSAEGEEAIGWQEKRFAKQLELDNHQQELAREYPKCFELFAAEKVASLAGTGEDALPGHAVISYFLGEEHLVVFVRTESGLHHELLPLAEGFFEQLENYLAGLREPPTEQAGDPQRQFIKHSRDIYQAVFAPVAELLPKGTEHLLIIPDGVLNYLPFGTLLREEPEGGTSFSDLPYLLRNYPISYAPSRSVWREMRGRKVSARGILAIAPSFAGEEVAKLAQAREDYLGPLAFNQREAAAVGAFGKAKALLGEEASLENFTLAYPDADILHLATHGKVEATESRYSYLAFTGAKGGSDSGKLYLSTIYAKDMPMNMVVLSACETGLGKLRRGEGLMSMARGFAYAGAKCIVPSLWSVNDLSTAKLMEAYYGQLAEGESKDGALRAAKLQYLAETKALPEAHPYYWAAFIVIGDAESIDFYQGFGWWPWSVLVMLPLVWGLYRYRVSRRQGD